MPVEVRGEMRVGQADLVRQQCVVRSLLLLLVEVGRCLADGKTAHFARGRPSLCLIRAVLCRCLGQYQTEVVVPQVAGRIA